MRPTVACTLILSLLAADAIAQRPAGQRGGRRQAAVRELELAHFTAERVSIDAPHLSGGKLECMVYVPKVQATEPQGDGEGSAAAAPSWPWALWLHGLNDGFHRFHNDGGAETIDRLRENGEIPAMLVVVPTVARQTMYVDGESTGEVETALVDDVAAYVATTWPNVARDAAHRAVLGVSMGGYGALKIALRHPDRFGVVAAHSSAILPADPAELPEEYARMSGRMSQMLGIDKVFGDPIDPAKWAQHMPMALIRDHDAKDFAALRIYFDVGTEDRYGFADPNAGLDEAMTEKEIAHTFRLVQGGGHSWGSDSMTANLEHSFRFVAAAFAATDAKKTDPAKKTDDK